MRFAPPHPPAPHPPSPHPPAPPPLQCQNDFHVRLLFSTFFHICSLIPQLQNETLTDSIGQGVGALHHFSSRTVRKNVNPPPFLHAQLMTCDQMAAGWIDIMDDKFTTNVKMVLLVATQFKGLQTNWNLKKAETYTVM